MHILEINSVAEAVRVMLAFCLGMAAMTVVLACAYALRNRDTKRAELCESQPPQPPQPSYQENIEKAYREFRQRRKLARLHALVRRPE